MEIYVYEILKKHSSMDKRLSGADIVRFLKDDYGIICDRKSVHRALENLITAVKNIKYTEMIRGKGEKQYSVKSDWYFESFFTSDEMTDLTLSILKNPSLSEDARVALFEKLKMLGHTPLNIEKITVCSLQKDVISEKETLFLIFDAIKAGKMITFSITEHKTVDKKRFLRDGFGNVRQYLIKPIDIVSVMGDFRLFGELGDTGFYAYFDIGEIYYAEITDIDFEHSSKNEKNYLPQNKAEAYLSGGGKRERIIISINAENLYEFKMRFGDGFEIVREYGNKAEIAFECNIENALPFLMQFGDAAEVIVPSKLRRALALTCKSTAAKYLASKQYRGYI